MLSVSPTKGPGLLSRRGSGSPVAVPRNLDCFSTTENLKKKIKNCCHHTLRTNRVNKKCCIVEFLELELQKTKENCFKYDYFQIGLLLL